MWQEVIVGLCVLTAVVFLLRRWFFTPKKPTACGGCNQCDTPSKTTCSKPGARPQDPC